MISSSKKQQPPHHHHHHPTTTTTPNASKNSYFRFTKTDLETTERELLLQCEETKRGDERNAIRAVVAGGEREAIRSALSLVGGFDDDVVGRRTAAPVATLRADRDDGRDDERVRVVAVRVGRRVGDFETFEKDNGCSFKGG